MKIPDLIARNKFLGKIIYTGTDQRTIKTRNNVLYSLLYRVIGAGISLFLVPLTLRYLNPTKYGVWLTLSAVISWLSLFDIGLGNGLRNRFAEALAKDDKVKAKIYVSTTYAILCIVVSVVYVVFLIVNHLVNWASLLNAPPDVAEELNMLAFYVFTFFLFRLVLGLILSILTADQKQSIVGMLDLMINLFSLVAVLVLPYFFDNSLLAVGVCISGITVLIPALASIFYFTSSYRQYAPSIRMVRFEFLKDLMALGFDFFVLSVSTIIMYFSQNLIISRLFSPAEVSTFNIAYKYFFYVVVIHTLVLNPILPATTEAYFKKDMNWIRKVLSKLVYIWMGLVALILVMVLFSAFAYSLWVGDQIKVPFVVSVTMAVYMVLFTWQSTFTYIINGIGKIKLQLYVILSCSLLIVPLSIFFVKNLHFGVEGVIFAGIICTIPGSIVIPIQLRKIITNQAIGLWNR